METVFLSLLLWGSPPAQGATIQVSPSDDLWTILSKVQAGDEVVLRAGTYTTPGYLSYTFVGTEAAPIVIRAAEGEAVHIVGSTPEQNVLNVGGSWYTLAGLEISGGSHGLRVETSDHASFIDLHIHDVGDVGISMNRPGHTYEAILIRGLHIHDTGGSEGECMYLGCNKDGCQVWDALIENNLCHDTTPTGQGDGIELKTGSHSSTIRHNVIYNTNYPGITLYSALGRGDNVVTGNLVFNTGDNGIQVVSEAEVSHNIVLNAGANGIHAKSSQGALPEDLRILHNTVRGAGSACLKGNDWAHHGKDILVANNALLCEGSLAIHLSGGGGAATILANATLGELSPGSISTLPIDDHALTLRAALDVWPADGSPLVDAGTVLDAATAAEDFNCLPRDVQPDIGAYEWQVGDNPGWLPVEGSLKPPCGVPPEETEDTAPPEAEDSALHPSDSDAPAQDTAPSAGAAAPTGCGGGCQVAPAGSWAGWWGLALGVSGLCWRRRRRAAAGRWWPGGQRAASRPARG